jgi:hypothetical protein
MPSEQNIVNEDEHQNQGADIQLNSPNLLHLPFDARYQSIRNTLSRLQHKSVMCTTKSLLGLEHGRLPLAFVGDLGSRLEYQNSLPLLLEGAGRGADWVHVQQAKARNNVLHHALLEMKIVEEQSRICLQAMRQRVACSTYRI